MDIPTKNTPPSNKDKSYCMPLDLIECEMPYDSIGNKLLIPTKIGMLYMNTINEPWIAIDLQNVEVTNKITSSIMGMSRFKRIKQGWYFKYLIQPPFFKLTHFSDFNKYIALISANHEGLNHPIYSWNKIVQYFGGSSEVSLNLL
ncbi:MAG: hypothetical protein ACXVAY_18765 [Mucilaginibacter sp.]